MRVIAIAVVAAGCVRDPVTAECPDVMKGELVVTEVNGPQTDETQPVWVELYNSSSASVDLIGTKVRFRRKDGSSEVPIIVRRSVAVPAGSYAVIGLVSDEQRPDFIDYGFLEDFHVTFLAAAAVDVEACGTLIDRARYDALPKTGSYALGKSPPNADDNEDPANWCVTQAATPKQPNPPCP